VVGVSLAWLSAELPRTRASSPSVTWENSLVLGPGVGPGVAFVLVALLSIVALLLSVALLLPDVPCMGVAGPRLWVASSRDLSGRRMPGWA